MKIEHGEECKTTFGTLKAGDVFKDKRGFTVMKTVSRADFNAVRLEDGVLCQMVASETAIPYPSATLALNG